jgi:hypothetical protein
MDYKKYSLENLENWLHDALSCGEASPHEIYSVIRKVVQDEYNYYKEQSQKCLGVLELLSGHRPVSLDKQEEGNHKTYDEMIALGYTMTDDGFWFKESKTFCDKDDPSPECKGAWNDFWEVDEDNSREYNLRESEYYNKRAQLDVDLEKIKAAGGFEWTPDPIVSRNDPDRIKYDGVWIYESPDKGKTITKRKPGSTEKFPVKEDKVVKWQLPVGVDGLTGECYVNFPDDLLEAANLKEGDQVEWVDRGDGSYLLRKI